MPKRSRKAGTRKRFGKRRLATVVVLLVVASGLGFVTYGLAFRGIVDFTFGGKNEVRQSYQLIAMSKFRAPGIDITHISLRNTGSTGITLIVTMHALNAVVSSAYYGPFSDTTNIQIYLPSDSGYRGIVFYLALPLQVSTFTIRVTVGQVLDFSSIPTLATSSLASIQPTTPTTLVYTQESASPINYQLTEQY